MYGGADEREAVNHTTRLHRLAWTLGLCLIVLLCVITVLIWKDHNHQTDALADQRADTVRLLRPDFPELHIKREADGWRMNAPCQMAVNEQRLEPLLGALQANSHQYAASEVDLEAAGLSPSQATVYLNEQRIEIGKTDLQGDRRYVLRQDTVEFVPEWVLSLINGGVSAFAQLHPFGEQLEQLAVNDQAPVDEQELRSWQNLSAQQIIEFSTLELDDNNESMHAAATIDGKRFIVELHEASDFIALRFAGAACAYILPTDSIPVADTE